MSRLEAKEKLEAAIQEYVETVHGAEGVVRTDYILSVAAINWHSPANATYYYHEESGPMHALAGLAFMRDEEIKMLNREEALSSDD